MTREEVYARFNAELCDIAADCEAEGLPSHGSTYEVRAEDLEEEYREQYPDWF